MHFVVSSYRARSSADWRRSLSGSPESLIRNGRTERYPSMNGVDVDDQVLQDGEPSDRLLDL